MRGERPGRESCGGNCCDQPGEREKRPHVGRSQNTSAVLMYSRHSSKFEAAGVSDQPNVGGEKEKGTRILPSERTKQEELVGD